MDALSFDNDFKFLNRKGNTFLERVLDYNRISIPKFHIFLQKLEFIVVTFFLRNRGFLYEPACLSAGRGCDVQGGSYGVKMSVVVVLSREVERVRGA